MRSIEALLELDDEAFVRAAYRALLDREPDPEGLGNYLEQLRDGEPKVELLACLALSDEGAARSRGSAALGKAVLRARDRYRARLAPEVQSYEDLVTLQDEAFVRAAYVALMGREADAEGIAAYLPALRAGAPKTRVLAALRRSAESARHEAALAAAGAPAHASLALLHEADRAIGLHRLQRVPLIGRGIAAALGLEREDAVHARLRRIENLVHRIAGSSAPADAHDEADGADLEDAEHESGDAAALLRPAQSVAPLLSTLPTRPDR